jgi:hypothetical protein
MHEQREIELPSIDLETDEVEDTVPRRRRPTLPPPPRPSLPPPVLPPLPRLRAPRLLLGPPPAEHEERPSVAPVARTLPPAIQTTWRKSPVALGAIAGLALFVVVALLATSIGRSAAASAAKVDLVVTVSGPSGRPLTRPLIDVDGVRRCESSPCRIAGLRESVVFVSVDAAGHAATAPRAVRVTPGGETALHIELAPDPALAAWLEPAAAGPPEAILDAPAPEPAPAPRPFMAAPKTKSVARLSFNASPAAAVILDGKPLGYTPRVVSVAPGEHQIVFQHHELGRRSRAIQVAAGEQRNVSIDF